MQTETYLKVQTSGVEVRNSVSTFRILLGMERLLIATAKSGATVAFIVQ